MTHRNTLRVRPLVTALGVAILCAVSLAAFPSTASAAELDLFAPLHNSAAFPNATGSSEYDRSPTEREVSVTVRHIARLAGKRVAVFVNGKKVGRMLVSSRGVAHREWDTERGQYVPRASAGDPIRVRTAAGRLVAWGSYAREVDGD